MAKETQHQLTVERLVREHPGASTSGFARRVRKIVDRNKYIFFQMIPDLHVIEEDARRITAFEVEDKNPLSVRKMALYCEVWRDMGLKGWTLVLKVCGRWGDDLREVDFAKRYALLNTAPPPSGTRYQDELSPEELKQAILAGAPIACR